MRFEERAVEEMGNSEEDRQLKPLVACSKTGWVDGRDCSVASTRGTVDRAAAGFVNVPTGAVLSRILDISHTEHTEKPRKENGAEETSAEPLGRRDLEQKTHSSERCPNNLLQIPLL